MKRRANFLFNSSFFDFLFIMCLDGRKLISVLPWHGMALHEADNLEEGVILFTILFGKILNKY